MKKFCGILCLFVLLACVGFSQQQSKVLSLKMESRILGVERDYSIYLPKGYNESGRRYPVLYLLHGAWGDHTSWLTLGNMQVITDEAIESGMSLDVIVVMPDAKGIGENMAGRNMGYFNVPGWAYEDYFFQEFVPFIDKTYRTVVSKGGRAIAGLSMGGGGATVYAQRHPDVFGSACSLSGLVGDVTRNIVDALDDGYEKSVRETSPVRYIANATEEQLRTLRSVRWYFDCGDDDFLYEGNTLLYMDMRKKNIPLQYRMRDGGHTWIYWQSALPDVLRYCSIGYAASVFSTVPIGARE